MRRGFTIVELLIVVVVIAILASITVVAYNGVTARANETAIKSDLRNFGTKMQMLQSENNEYPAVLTSDMNLSFTKGIYGTDDQDYNLRYCQNAAEKRYVLLASLKDGRYFKVNETGIVSTNAKTHGYGVCSLVGLSSTNPASANNGYHKSNSTGVETWATWVK